MSRLRDWLETHARILARAIERRIDERRLRDGRSIDELWEDLQTEHDRRVECEEVAGKERRRRLQAESDLIEARRQYSSLHERCRALEEKVRKLEAERG